MKTYKNLSEALKDFPKTPEEFEEEVRLEHLSRLSKKGTEQQEATTTFEVKFIPNKKKRLKKNKSNIKIIITILIIIMLAITMTGLIIYAKILIDRFVIILDKLPPITTI